MCIRFMKLEAHHECISSTDAVHLLDDNAMNIGTGCVISLEGSMCHHRLVPRGYLKVRVVSMCGPDPIPYPWTEAIYWHNEPVRPNSFLMWPAQWMKPVKQDTSGMQGYPCSSANLAPWIY